MTTTTSGDYAAPRADLAEELLEFDLQADREGFIAPKIAPAMEVGERAGVYTVMPVRALLREYADTRAPGAAYGRTDGEVEQRSFSTTEHGLEEPCDDRLTAIYKSQYDAEVVAAERVRDGILRGHERRVITKAVSLPAEQTTDAAEEDGNGNSLYGGAWTTPMADPYRLVRAARAAVRSRVGKAPGCLIISWETFEKLAELDAIIERIQYQYSGRQLPADANLQPATVGAALGVEELIVAGSVTNTGNIAEPAQLETMWPAATGLLLVKGSGMDTRRPQFMRTFHWGADGSTIGGAFEEYRDETIRSTVIRCRMETSEEIVYPEAAELLTGLLE